MKLHNYQERIVAFLHNHPFSILSVDMGLGKTAAVLHFLDQTRPYSCLIVAPKRVAETVWLQEAQKWSLNSIADKMVIVAGTKAKRAKAILDKDHPYKIISRDNLQDVAGQTFGFVIVDELTSFKNYDSQRSKALRSINASRVIGLTGTFLANGAIDIFGQAVAAGLKMEYKNFYAWRAVYFRDVMRGSGKQFAIWKPAFPLEDILRPIQKDIFTLTAADYLDIPKVSEFTHPVMLSEESRSAYDNLQSFLQLEIGGEVRAFDEEQKFAKLQTLCNGFIYETDESGNTHAIRGNSDNEKLNAVVDFIERCKGENEPVLLFYAFREEAAWLSEMLNAKNISWASVKQKDFLDKWNSRSVDVLFAHPASAGHGLNLQHGGRIAVWSSLTYNYELFAQANARLARQGQTKPVQIHYFVATNSVEEQQVVALRNKDKEQQKFLQLTK